MPIIKKTRTCLICNKAFKPMTDNQWEVVRYEHELMSRRHRKRRGLDGISDGYQMEVLLRRLGYSRDNSVVDASVLDGNTQHARKKAKEMVQRRLRSEKLQSMLLRNDQAGKLIVQALKLDPENDKEFHDFITLLGQALDSVGLNSTTL